ncbi:unnamed protein product [Prunus brigantina]
MGIPKEHLFGVDYLEPNRITEREIGKYRAEYFIPDSVGIRIPTPTESLSKSKEGEVVFFTDVLLQGANCLTATERGHFISGVPTSQKTWRKRRVILSGDWESPSGHPARFHIPTTFQIAGRPPYRSLKQPNATQSEIRQIERVRLRVPAVERVYPKLLFTANLIKAQLVNPAGMTGERSAAEAKRMNESSKRRLMMGYEGKKKKSRQPEAVPMPSEGVGVDDQTLSERLRRLNFDSALPRSAAAASKRPFTVDLDAEPVPKRGRQADAARAIFAAEDDDAPANPVTLACPSKTVQFANHMILGSQMELSEIEDLPKKFFREEAGRAFRLQASASMDMWLCVKRAINAAEKAKKAYEDGRAKVAEAGKAIQTQANLVKDMQAAERQIKGYEAMESTQLAAREAKEAIQVAMEESERTRASDIEATVQEASWKYRHSTDFSILLDKEVGSEMVDLVYRFKRYNPGVNLNLNFIADPPPLPEGMTEEMIEDYEGEDAPEEPADLGAEEADADAEEEAIVGAEGAALQ